MVNDPPSSWRDWSNERISECCEEFDVGVGVLEAFHRRWPYDYIQIPGGLVKADMEVFLGWEGPILDRVSYMSDHILWNLLNKFEEKR